MTTPHPRHTPPARRWLALGLFAITAALWAIGCEQGDGERCQRDQDCGSPLTCNLATLTCSAENTSGQIDAGIADGPPADAAPDAAPDAMIDAP